MNKALPKAENQGSMLILSIFLYFIHYCRPIAPAGLWRVSYKRATVISRKKPFFPLAFRRREKSIINSQRKNP